TSSFENIKLKNCEFNNVTIKNSTMSQKLMNELQKHNVILENIQNTF
ncbi:pentapeptide repeat-containing protein, partial [Staphylococcus saccharolyticus]